MYELMTKPVGDAIPVLDGAYRRTLRYRILNKAWERPRDKSVDVTLQMGMDGFWEVETVLASHRLTPDELKSYKEVMEVTEKVVAELSVLANALNCMKAEVLGTLMEEYVPEAKS